MRSRRFGITILAAFLALGGLAFGNGLNLNSLGTRALTMGGAFVGLADDFSAVFWNPAGAAGFKTKYLGFYATDLIPTSRYRLDLPTQTGMATFVNAKSKLSHYLGGMFAYYHPVSDRLVLGLRRLHAVRHRDQLEQRRSRPPCRRRKLRLVEQGRPLQPLPARRLQDQRHDLRRRRAQRQLRDVLHQYARGRGRTARAALRPGPRPV